MFFVEFPLSFLDPATFDLTTLSFIASILFLSLLSLSFIFHLRLKSRTSQHLERFNSLWTVRFFLVAFISLWALNELLRLPFFRRRYLLPILHQSNLCKLHALFSLGLFQPCFLITLLFLINVSAKNKTSNDFGAMPFLLLTSMPIFLLQIIIVFYSPLKDKLPHVFNQSYVVIKHDLNHRTVLCAYPLLSSLAFAVFGIGYMLCFVFSCWKVASLVINKSLRLRVYGLAFTVVLALPLQIIFLALSVLWRPDEPAYSVVSLLVFFTTFLCAAVGEGILVIVPIADSLAAGVDAARWDDSGQPLKAAGEGS